MPSAMRVMRHLQHVQQWQQHVTLANEACSNIKRMSHQGTASSCGTQGASQLADIVRNQLVEERVECTTRCATRSAKPAAKQANTRQRRPAHQQEQRYVTWSTTPATVCTVRNTRHPQALRLLLMNAAELAAVECAALPYHCSSPAW
jgi:hypothetical protein